MIQSLLFGEKDLRSGIDGSNLCMYRWIFTNVKLYAIFSSFGTTKAIIVQILKLFPWEYVRMVSRRK